MKYLLSLSSSQNLKDQEWTKLEGYLIHVGDVMEGNLKELLKGVSH